ncbi:MAG: antibiotic biosynthesis monooxygenase [Deltaproteobacteria bacterium]|nr:antibiotic biosynthesis monooxygenase [Deltaproteobacteria bacterium]
MVVVLIRTQVRADADHAAYDALGDRMDAIVRTIPGFVSSTGYTSADGDAISLIRFASHEALRAWRDHPEHAEAQRRGKAEFYASYEVEVCEVTRAYAFP